MQLPDAARTFAERFGLDEDAQEALSLLLSGEVSVSAAVEPGPVGLPDAYEDAEPLGQGGMGQVYRVHDRTLRRRVALKTLRPEQAGHPDTVRRFLDEAQATSQLQHPGVVPVHGFGRLPDGRPYFTMPEVRGRSFHELIEAGVPLRRRVEVLRRVCDAVGYAHARQVVHRDLKPDNIMVGEHGEVLVLDWGLALVAGTAPKDSDTATLGVSTDSSASGERLTAFGAVLGTPSYMAPEQVVGDPITVQTDVYALGGLLYGALTGRPPRTGSVADVLAAVAYGAPLKAPEGPAPLVDLALACLASEPEDRPADAVAVGEALQDWLDGAERLAEAEALYREAVATLARAEAIHRRAEVLRRQAGEMLESLGDSADVAAKAEGWSLEDAAAAAQRQGDILQVQVEQTLWAALTRSPDHLPSRRLLAERTRSVHEEAEQRRDDDAALRAETVLRAQLVELPDADATPLARYLDGEGCLTLHTEPAGAEVLARPWVRRQRRLVLGDPVFLGRTPLDGVPLGRGSWQLTIAHPEAEEVSYPVYLERGAHWDGVPPEGAEPEVVPLPARASLGGACYVPPGWFLAGGDPDAPGSVPRTWLWCHGFVMERFHVSCGSWASFLTDLHRSGREAEAERYGPREWHGDRGMGPPFWRPDADGRYHIGKDGDGDVWHEEWPILMVDRASALAYATWQAARDGLPWRLPGEFEWEKAARGVDGRFFPWGDQLDPSWCAMRRSPVVQPATHDEYPVDVSPYGLRHMAGNVATWCLEAREDAPIVGPRVEVPPVDLPADSHQARGGHWSSPEGDCRGAGRGFVSSRRGLYSQSLRLVRPWP